MDPRLVEACDAWLGSADRLAERLDLHREWRRELLDDNAAIARTLGAERRSWWAESSTRLVERLERFTGANGTLADVRDRREAAASLWQRTIVEAEAAWDEVIEDVAARVAGLAKEFA